MDPEILRALKDGHSPADIAAELTVRGLPVPPELKQMMASAPQPFASYVNAGAGQTPQPGPQAGLPPGAGGAAGTAALGAGTVGYWKYGPKSKALRQLLQATEGQSGLGNASETLAELQRTGRGNLATMGDLTDELRALADFTATSNPAARGKMGRINEARRQGVPGRVGQDITDLAGYAAPRQEIQQTAAQQAAWAKGPDGFEGLRQANPILQNPAALAAELAKPENAPLRSAYLEARAQSMSAGGTGAPSFRSLQDVKRGLDQQITAAFASGNGDLGRELKGARERLFDIMEQQVGPQYQQAVATYRNYSRLQEAQQAGLDLWSNRGLQLPDIQAQMKGLSPAELEAFRRGVAGGLLTQVENAKTNSNIANQLSSESAATNAKLKLIFGDKAKFDEFMKRMQVEKQLSLLGEAVGGPSTARRVLAADAGGPVEAAADAAHIVASPTTGALSVLGRKSPGFFARRMAAQLEPYFTAQGPELQKMLQQLESLRP